MRKRFFRKIALGLLGLLAATFCAQGAFAAPAVTGRTVFAGTFHNYTYPRTGQPGTWGPYDATYWGYGTTGGALTTIGLYSPSGANPYAYDSNPAVYQQTANGLLIYKGTIDNASSTSGGVHGKIGPAGDYGPEWVDLNDLSQNTASAAVPFGNFACRLASEGAAIHLTWEIE